MLIPAIALGWRHATWRPVVTLLAPALALHWLLYLSGGGPGAVHAAETGISWLALHHVELHVEFIRNLFSALYLLLAVAVFALATAARRPRRIAALAVRPG